MTSAISTDARLTRGNAGLEGTRQTDISVIEFGPASHWGEPWDARRPHIGHCRVGYVVIVVAALLFAACGGDDDDSAGANDTTPTSAESGKLSDLGHGVTADSIKIGVAIVDYDAIKDFVDFTCGDQQKTAEVFVDYINANGGVDGRKIEPVYRKYPPIPGQEPSVLSLCTAWTEDDDVFAVLGVFIDFSGDAQLCLTRDHETIHIGHELEQPWIDDSPPGLMLTPDTTKEAAATILINLLDKQDKLKGKTVAILADSDGENRANDVIAPALKDGGADLGSTATLTISGTDTSAAQGQLDSFIEKWKSENVDTVFMVGLNISAKQFVQKLKSEMPDVQLITDASSTAEQGQDLVAAGTNPNPYDGMLGTIGATDSERWNNKSKLLQQCVDIYEQATGQDREGSGRGRAGARRQDRGALHRSDRLLRRAVHVPDDRREDRNGPDQRQLDEDGRLVRQDRHRAHRHRVALQGQVRRGRRLPARRVRSRQRAVRRLEAAHPGAGRERRHVQGRCLSV